MTDYRKLGVTAEDPPGSEFDMYSLATPEGEWAYCLAEHCVLYRRAARGGRCVASRGRGVYGCHPTLRTTRGVTSTCCSTRGG
jgi:hypothetical protein